MEGGARYWAFLSYSHHDRRCAERLHRALETYRLPQRLVGRQGPMGTVPERLHPIFRDRDELTASSQIGPVVEAALAASRALVVLCSPAAAASHWVDGEIAAFRSLDPQAPILCVLCAGEPLASRDAATASSECMPPALRAQSDGVGVSDTTPLAVDLRPQGDGWRLGVQKLAAGLAGVPLDQLVQRDALRRQRRLGWLSAALAMIALALGTMAIFALRARNEAQQQRAQAEGQIEYMLGELRKKLEPIGRLDVLDAVGARALSYYDSQDPRSLDADALGRRSRALHMIGEFRDRRGDRRGALQAFRRASVTTAELLQRNPDDPQSIFDHAQSVYWVAYAGDWQIGKSMAAEQSFLQYQRLAQRLVAKDPANMAWQAEVAYSHNTLGVMLMDQGRVSEASVQFEMSRRVNAHRVANKPSDVDRVLDLGQNYSWLSSASLLMLWIDGAAQLRQQEIRLYAPILQRDPRNAVVLDRMMLARRFLADVQIAGGHLDEAAAAVDESNRLADAQLRLEPDNTDWQQAAAKARLMRAELSGWQGHPDRGMADVARARPLLAGLLAHDASVWAWRVELQETLAQVESDLLRRLSRRAAALAVSEASLQRLLVVMRDPDQQTKSRRWLALAAGRVARLREEAGDRVAAAAKWRIVSEAFQEHAQQNDAEALVMLMLAYRARGENAAADALQRQLQLAGYRHPDFIAALASARASSTPTAQENP